jgi:peptide deformylase
MSRSAPDQTAKAGARAAAARRAFERIRQWGDPVLRSRTREVTDFDERLEDLAAQMVELMDEVGGAGLAAPQVGSLQRLFVYRFSLHAPPQVLVNPRIAEASEELLRDLEGCLSLGRAQVHVEVPRAERVVLDAQLLDGTPIRVARATATPACSSTSSTTSTAS